MIPVDWTKVLRLFSVPGYSHVYVLGSFATHVTLYSQQIRALNLIAALVETGVVWDQREVVVVGGGAAGLTAAAAAATEKAKVWLLEEREGLIELQRNNRQRWIHPHIYEWPDEESKEDNANLPLLTWTAGSARNVASQIRQQWDDLSRLLPIKCRTNVREISINQNANGIAVSWSDPEDGAVIKYNPVLILAVGFGLEPRTQTQESYWTEDDLDTIFRVEVEKEEWLVSGYGDGAFSDLIRLCIRDTRPPDIAKLFATVPGIDGVKDDLRQIHSTGEMSVESISTAFNGLSIRGLEDVLRPLLRRHGPKLVLNGPDQYPYGVRASVLNRLIVRVLAKLGSFSFWWGSIATNNIKPTLGGGFLVPLKEGGSRTFNRVILRHGPTRHPLESSFKTIWDACVDLRREWKQLHIRQDETRKPLWASNLFRAASATVAAQALSSSAAFAQAVETFGVLASGLLIEKELRSDGVSTSTVEIQGLTVRAGELKGIELSWKRTSGQFGQPELDAAAKRLGLYWVNDLPQSDGEPEANFSTEISTAQEVGRRLQGRIMFPAPLKPLDQPINFGWSVTVLNGDALSSWEFEQMYKVGDRVHVDGRPMELAIEYFAKFVWFPVETLKMRLTLPSRAPGPPFPTLFQLDVSEGLPVAAVVHDRLLNLSPPSGSVWGQSSRWKRVTKEESIGGSQFRNISAQTWELAVEKPRVGSCYSIDWHLPSMSPTETSQKIENETREFRRQLLRYRDQRKRSQSDQWANEVHKLFENLYVQLHAKYRTDEPDERFSVSLLTYHDEERHLVFVDSIINQYQPGSEIWNLWLPFGAGLVGACFRQQADDAFIYLASGAGKQGGRPEPYIPFRKWDQHSVLLSIPLGHPDFDHSSAANSFERSRQRIALLDVGSTSPKTRLYDFAGPNMQVLFQELIAMANAFSQTLWSQIWSKRQEK